jgi:hypothetical protein
MQDCYQKYPHRTTSEDFKYHFPSPDSKGCCFSRQNVRWPSIQEPRRVLFSLFQRLVLIFNLLSLCHSINMAIWKNKLKIFWEFDLLHHPCLWSTDFYSYICFFLLYFYQFIPFKTVLLACIWCFIVILPNMHMIYPDQINSLLTICTGFIVLFSYMFIKYFSHSHTPFTLSFHPPPFGWYPYPNRTCFTFLLSHKTISLWQTRTWSLTLYSLRGLM